MSKKVLYEEYFDKIEVYKCRETGKIFQTKISFNSHMKNLLERKAEAARLLAAEDLYKEFLRLNFWDNVKSFAQLEEAFRVHANVLYRRALKREYRSHKKVPKEVAVPFLFERFKTIPKPRITNVCNYWSHPIGKKSNWGGRDKDYPTHFPGWQFSNWGISFFSDGKNPISGSDIFKETRLHTGTGGAGSWFRTTDDGRPRVFNQYCFEMWESDWPALSKAYSEIQTWLALTNETEINPSVKLNEMFPADTYVPVYTPEMEEMFK